MNYFQTSLFFGSLRNSSAAPPPPVPLPDRPPMGGILKKGSSLSNSTPMDLESFSGSPEERQCEMLLMKGKIS